MRTPNRREITLIIRALNNYRDHLLGEGTDEAAQEASEVEDLLVSVEQLWLAEKVVGIARSFFPLLKKKSRG